MMKAVIGYILNILLQVSALNTGFNVDEINSMDYAVDILNTPVVKDQVSWLLNYNFGSYIALKCLYS